MRSVKELMRDGYSWEEAEDIIWNQVEQARDAEKDRRLEEMMNEKSTDTQQEK